jgi:hypothetical protein
MIPQIVFIVNENYLLITCWLLALSAQVSVNLGKNFVNQSTFPVHQHAFDKIPF